MYEKKANMTVSEHISNNKGFTKRHPIVKSFQETANDQFHYINVTSGEEFKVRLGSELTTVFKGQKADGFVFFFRFLLVFCRTAAVCHLFHKLQCATILKYHHLYPAFGYCKTMRGLGHLLAHLIVALKGR